MKKPKSSPILASLTRLQQAHRRVVQSAPKPYQFPRPTFAEFMAEPVWPEEEA